MTQKLVQNSGEDMRTDLQRLHTCVSFMRWNTRALLGCTNFVSGMVRLQMVVRISTGRLEVGRFGGRGVCNICHGGTR